MSQHCPRNCASSAPRSRNVTNTGRNRDAVAMTSGHDRHGGHEPLTLPRGEPADPVPAVDAGLGHEPGGCCRADARERPHYGHDPHSACRLVVAGQDLGEGHLAGAQLLADGFPLGFEPQALEPSGFAFGGRQRRRDGLRARAVLCPAAGGRGAVAPGLYRSVPGAGRHLGGWRRCGGHGRRRRQAEARCDRIPEPGCHPGMRRYLRGPGLFERIVGACWSRHRDAPVFACSLAVRVSGWQRSG